MLKSYEQKCLTMLLYVFVVEKHFFEIITKINRKPESCI